MGWLGLFCGTYCNKCGTIVSMNMMKNYKSQQYSMAVETLIWDT